MQRITLSICVIFFITGLFIRPVFVFAKENCFVDIDAKDDGDGSKDAPYRKINKALDKKCIKINIAEGVYDESITVDVGVSLDGVDSGDVVITGKVKMNNASSINNITIEGRGITVLDGASVKIENSDIKKAHIGIETIGRGKLIIKNSKLYKNKKALYLQADKDVQITNNEVYDNTEEGIDIRANVDGTISDNLIYNNGESGIEVILGKSDLKIYNNKIKKNSASGIALQYYKHADKLGGIKIKNNTIISNKDYGVNCKIPSGGSPSITYWTQSVEMLGNKIYNNKDGEFAVECHFEDKKISNATKTKKDIEQEKTEEQSLREQQQKKEENLKKKEQEEKQKRQQEQQEQEKKRQKLQKEKNLETDVNQALIEVEKIYNNNLLNKEKIMQRPSVILFLVGPDYKELRTMAESINKYDEKIKFAHGVSDNIADEGISNNIEMNILEMNKKREEIYNFAKEYNNRFSLFGWIIKKYFINK